MCRTDFAMFPKNVITKLIFCRENKTRNSPLCDKKSNKNTVITIN